MADVTIEDVYNAFVAKVFECPSFKTKTQIYQSYVTETARPSVYVSILTSEPITSIDGLPTGHIIRCELHVRVDRSGYPNRTGPEIMFPLEREIAQVLRPSPVTGFQTLGFPRGWVMHCLKASTEYFYDLIADHDVAEMVITYEVRCSCEL